LQDYLFDAKFEQKLDRIEYQIAYRNGLLNLKTLEFRAGIKASDYLTKTLDYDYEKATAEHKAKVRHELLKICNMNEIQLQYYLSVFGAALTGDASKVQEYWNMRGQKASNGKSVVLEALTDILPIYVKSIDSKVMELNRPNRHKAVAEWRGKRVVWANEMSKKEQDGEFIKLLSDGTSVEFQVMYGTTDDMPIRFKMFFVSNNTMQVNCDAAVKRRMRMMQFDSKFVDDIEDNYEKCEFKKDRSFKDHLSTTYKFALSELLFEYSKKFWDDGFNLKAVPVEWKAEAEEVAADNNELNDFIDTYYEFEAGVKTLKTEIEEHWSRAKDKITLRTFKDALRALGKEFKYDSHEFISGRKGRGYWTGIKIRVEPDGDEE
jgi:phage/plasmid-associated DNA primase